MLVSTDENNNLKACMVNWVNLADKYRLSCDCEYNLVLIVRVMFANFAKIGRTAGASPIWQNFQTSRVLLIPNCINNIA